MPIELNCPSCNQLLRVPDNAAGKHARCAQCQAVILVPSDGGSVAGDAGSGNAGGGDAGAASGGFGALPSQQPDSPFTQSPPPKPQAGDQVNPFQSPTTEAYQGMPGYGTTGDLPVTPTAVDVGVVINKAYELWSQNLGILVGITVVVMVINGGFGAVVSALQESGEDELILLGFVLNIISSLVGMFLGIGQTKIMLKLARNRPAEFTELFSGGPLFLPILGASIIAGIAVMLGFLLLIIPGIILLVLAWTYYFLIVDQKTGALESFNKAFEIGKQNAGTTIVMWLASVLIMIIGMLACCIGIIFAAPLVGMIWTVGYLMMAGQIKG